MTTTPGRGCSVAAGRRSDAGMVTAETAITLPALALVLVAGLVALATVVAQLRCVDAAQVAARLAARGEPRQAVVAAARAVAPAGAVVRLAAAGAAAVRVEVTSVLRLPGAAAVRIAPTVRATFVVPLEPGVGPWQP